MQKGGAWESEKIVAGRGDRRGSQGKLMDR